MEKDVFMRVDPSIAEIFIELDPSYSEALNPDGSIVVKLEGPTVSKRNIVRKKTHFFFRLYRARSEVTYPGPIGPRITSTRAWEGSM